MGAREDRIAHDETVFREANEDLRGEWNRLEIDSEDEALFICECGDPACKQPVRLAIADYEAVRGDPNTFAVVPGHDDPATEELVHSVVVENDRFAVVRKRRGLCDETEQIDPRG